MGKIGKNQNNNKTQQNGKQCIIIEMYHSWTGHVILVATAGTTILVPCHVVKSLLCIWRSGTRRWNLRVSENQRKMRHLYISSTGIQFSNELQWLDLPPHLWPSDVILWHRSESTLVQVTACCLTAPSHYLNQRWLIISKVQWHWSEANFTRSTSAINHWNLF